MKVSTEEFVGGEGGSLHVLRAACNKAARNGRHAFQRGLQNLDREALVQGKSSEWVLERLLQKVKEKSIASNTFGGRFLEWQESIAERLPDDCDSRIVTVGLVGNAFMSNSTSSSSACIPEAPYLTAGATA